MEPALSFNNAYSHQIFKYACTTGDATHLTRLIGESKFPVRQVIPEIMVEPLSVAITLNSLPVVQVLLENGANPNANDSNVINWAIYLNSPQIVHLLEKGTDPNDPEADSLRVAVNTGRIALVKLLLYYGADVMVNNLSALRLALKQDKSNILELLVDRAHQMMEDNPNVMDEKTKSFLKLCRAVINNDAVQVTQVLETDGFASPADCETHSVDLVHRMTGRDVREVFVRAGLAVKNIYLLAVAEKDVELQELCLGSPKFNPDDLKFDKHALNMACQSNQLEVIKLLVNKYGHKLDSRDSQGLTPLFSIQNPALLRGLLSTFPEVNLDVITDHSFTLLESQKNCKSYAIMLEYGANPRFQNQKNEHVINTDVSRQIACNYSSKCAVIQHLQKLILLDSNYANDLMPAIIPNMDIDNFPTLVNPSLQKEYEEELMRLQSERISQSTSKVAGKTLRDVIFFSANEAARYARNVHLLKIYKAHDEDFEKYAPYFGFALNRQLRRGQLRRDLLDKAGEMFCSAVGSGMPADFAELIFGDLSNSQMARYS